MMSKFGLDFSFSCESSGKIHLVDVSEYGLFQYPLLKETVFHTNINSNKDWTFGTSSRIYDIYRALSSLSAMLVKLARIP